MKCPKCNSDCRLKMTGAVCLNNNCNWSSHDRIAAKFQEDAIEQDMQQLEDEYGHFDGAWNDGI